MAAVIVGTCSLAADPATDDAVPEETPAEVFLAYDPLNNLKAVLSVPKWPRWYYHTNFTFGDAQPNDNAVPVFQLRLRRRSPTYYGDMLIEVANAAGRGSSDETGHIYDLRITQTAWFEGETSSPEFVLDSDMSGFPKPAGRDMVRGLTVRQIDETVRSAVEAAFGDDGENPGKCATLNVRLTEPVSVDCVAP